MLGLSSTFFTGTSAVLELSAFGRSVHGNYGCGAGESDKNPRLQLQPGPRCAENLVARQVRISFCPIFVVVPFLHTKVIGYR